MIVYIRKNCDKIVILHRHKVHGEKRTHRARVRNKQDAREKKRNLPARGPLVFTRALLVKHKRRAREERAEDSQSSCA